MTDWTHEPTTRAEIASCSNCVALQAQVEQLSLERDELQKDVQILANTLAQVGRDLEECEQECRSLR